MPLLIVFCGIILLFTLIVFGKLNAFLSFIIISILIGILNGMPINNVIDSIENGFGNTLGSLVMILGLGAMFGKIVAESGAAQQISFRLIDSFGIKYVQLAVMVAGFIIGLTMFYEVGFVILVPLIFTVASSSNLPLIYVGLPLLSSLSVAHGYLPPHPGPTAVAIIFDADIGRTLIYGIIVAIPAIIISGPVLSKVVKNIDAKPLDSFLSSRVLPLEKLPGFFISIFSALLPVFLIGLSTLLQAYLVEENQYYEYIKFIGNPSVALLISFVFSIYSLGFSRGQSITEIMKSSTDSIKSVTMVLLIIAGSGALKEILIDSGVSQYIGGLLNGSNLSPLFLGWVIATLIRVCVGSATVAALTSAGILVPIVNNADINPELMVLAIGSGSLMLSHVNDGGFWLFKEYFNVSVKDTLSTWTVMETSIGIIGIIGVLILDIFV
ncbi:MAG: gluconate transporter [Flavobacteriaceae bacterium]|nr:gluconate transporter [Flavobacteriaceae bacterium]|tara:strand:+ start:471 stop:1787 length:1317 start_codon:yes stop_codon:yes gene_type:complete